MQKSYQILYMEIVMDSVSILQELEAASCMHTVIPPYAIK